jgi:hypothetical protein
MAMFVGLMLDLNDAAAAKQSVACVIGCHTCSQKQTRATDCESGRARSRPQ